MPLDNPTALRLGDQMDLGRLAIKAALQDVRRVSEELVLQGHADRLVEVRSRLYAALGLYETAVRDISHELAAKLADSLPGYTKEETHAD